jgi:DNA-binding transcriptional ArsR family regulator
MHPFEIMCEPIRRTIVEILACGEHTSGEIADAIIEQFGVGRPAVQHHLAILLRDGWVRTADDWPSKFYILEPDAIESLEARVLELRARWDARTGFFDSGDPLTHFPGSAAAAEAAPAAEAEAEAEAEAAASASGAGAQSGTGTGTRTPTRVARETKRGRRGHGMDPDDPWRHPSVGAAGTVGTVGTVGAAGAARAAATARTPGAAARAPERTNGRLPKEPPTRR